MTPSDLPETRVPSFSKPPEHDPLAALPSRLLRILRSSRITLDEIAASLEFSHPIIREHISALENFGFEFEKHPFLGLRLTGTPETLHAGDLVSRSQTLEKWTLQIHPTTHSTNDLGLEYGGANLPTPCAIFAEEQTAGRGRLGRQWFSEKNANLCFSAVLRPELSVGLWHHISAVTALAVTRAIEVVTGLSAGLKWPNDIFFREKKLGGILVESVIQTRSPSFVVIGVGLNVNQTVFPEQIMHRATSLQNELGAPANRAALAVALLEYLDEYITNARQNLPELLDQYRSKSLILGKNISALEPDGTEISGIAEQIDGNGHLAVRTSDGCVRRLSAGEVTVRGWED